MPNALRIALAQLEASVHLWSAALASVTEPVEQALKLHDEHPDEPHLAMFAINRESLQAFLALSYLLVGRFEEATSVAEGLLEPATLARPTKYTVLALGIRALALAWADDDMTARPAVRQGLRVLQAFPGTSSDPLALHVARAWLGDDADHGLAAASAIARRVGYTVMTALVSLASARPHLTRRAPRRASLALEAADDTIAMMPEPGVLASLAERLRSQIPATDAAVRGELNDREIEVLTAVARGATRRQAARELHLSINTVKTYLRSAYRKLDAGDRDEAIAARALNLIGDQTTYRVHTP